VKELKGFAKLPFLRLTTIRVESGEGIESRSRRSEERRRNKQWNPVESGEGIERI